MKRHHFVALVTVLCITAALLISCNHQAPIASTNESAHTPSETVCSHIWLDATCEDPKTCSKCAATEGEPLGHIWEEATCTEPKHCLRCSKTDGEPLADHIYQDGQCIYCGEIDPKVTEYIAAYIAYCGLTDAHSNCVEIMNAIYGRMVFRDI